MRQFFWEKENWTFDVGLVVRSKAKIAIFFVTYFNHLVSFSIIETNWNLISFAGVPRTTIEQKEAGDFPVFNDPQKRFSTFNLKYSHDLFDKLSGLVEFNTMLNEELIKDTMAECVQKRRTMQICHW